MMKCNPWQLNAYIKFIEEQLLVVLINFLWNYMFNLFLIFTVTLFTDLFIVVSLAKK